MSANDPEIAGFENIVRTAVHRVAQNEKAHLKDKASK